jgi:plasmid maintenance system antidote protein VapI
LTKKQLADLEEQLRDALVQTGLSMNELARRSGVSQPILSRFVRGDRSLTLPVAARLCSMLGLRLCAEEKPAQAPTPKKRKKK